MNPQQHTAETTGTSKPKRQPRGIQPKIQAPKNAIATKRRRQIIARELLKGTPAKEAGIIAGFSPRTAGQQVSMTLKNPEFQSTLIDAMEKLGMNDDYLAEHLRLLIEGKKIISANIIFSGGGFDLANAGSTTKGFVEAPDYSAMARGLDLAYRLMGKYKDRTEVDLRQPVQIIIKKFCSRGQKDITASGDSPAA
jgi:hypothetical protein